jgi:hypothetical protein
MIIQAHKNIPLKEARWEALYLVHSWRDGNLLGRLDLGPRAGRRSAELAVIQQVIQEMAVLHPFFIKNEMTQLQTTNPNRRGSRESG